MNLVIGVIARVCHEANRAFCQEVGDPVQPAWDDAPDWQRESCFDGVRYHLDHPEAGPSASHNNWLKHKQATGWKYGPVKDEAKKEHPCMVPFKNLPPHQQAKDRLFKAIVDALRPKVGGGK